MTPAAHLQKHLKLRVKETGGEYRKLSWAGRRGATDTFVWWDGPISAFIEVKAGGDTLSTLQEREITRLRKAGFNVFIVSTKSDINQVVSLLTHP